MKRRIRLERAYDEPSDSSGRRILIDRLWPRGVTKGALAVDAWLKEVAPSTELRKWFAHDPARWDEFRERYLAELDANPAPLDELREHAATGPLTLVYGTKAALHHGIVLAELLRG